MARRPARPLPRPAHRLLIAGHVAVSVGLLGDSAGFLAVALKAAMSDDPAFREAAYDVLRTFALAFGIPLSFASLLTGLALGATTRWGILRYPWVVAKLALVVTVILVGALVLRGALDDGPGAEDALIAGSAWDVAALLLATWLGVAKPGGPLRRGARG